jgi:putative protein-disulfide isomerase
MEDKVQNEQQQVDRIEIVYYTDPLDCWSWAFEPQWRRLLYEYGDKIETRYVMSGLIPSWKSFSDETLSVSRPQQMGPVWMEASQVSGMYMNDKIWVQNPPASSFPACIAVKSAALQSKEAGEKLLRLLREAVMLRGEDIAKQNVLVSAAKLMADTSPGLLNLHRFENDLTGETGLEAFRKDYNEAQARNITRFPTMIIRATGKPAIITTGYRPYTALISAICQVAPDIKPARVINSLEDYMQHYKNLTDRELQEIVTLIQEPEITQ